MLQPTSYIPDAMPFDLFDRGSSFTLTRQDGLTVSLAQALRTRHYVLVFLASQWWAPCRGVTAQLRRFHHDHHATHSFEVIFLSTDKTEGAMHDFFHSAHGDWLCLDYADARRLEAEMAGDAAFHCSQLPACLVFELDREAMKRCGSEVRGQTGNNSPSAPFSSSSSFDAPFARLVTKHGREMLARDREGLHFPWHDDGWSDSASVPRTPIKDTPDTTVTAETPTEPLVRPATPSGEENAIADEEVVAEEAEGKEQTAVEERDNSPVVMHTDPRLDPVADTPHTRLIIKHPPAHTSITKAHHKDDGKEEVAEQGVEEEQQQQQPPASDSSPDAHPTESTDATARDIVESKDSCRQLSYPESPPPQKEKEKATAEEGLSKGREKEVLLQTPMPRQRRRRQLMLLLLLLVLLPPLILLMWQRRKVFRWPTFQLKG